MKSLQILRSEISPRISRIRISAAAWRRFADCANAIPLHATSRLHQQRTLAEALEKAFGVAQGEAIKAVLLDRSRGICFIDLSEHSEDSSLWARFLVALGRSLGSISMNPDRRQGFEAGLLVDPARGIVPSHIPSPWVDDHLHNDGNRFLQEFDDFVAILLAERENCEGGGSKLLHLDDWRELPKFTSSTFAEKPFRYAVARGERPTLQKGEATDSDRLASAHIIERSLFYRSSNGYCSRVSPGYMHPVDVKQGQYIEEVQRALAETRDCIELQLEPGQLYVVNNTFVLHGRRSIEPHAELYRVVNRVRGFFKARAL